MCAKKLILALFRTSTLFLSLREISSTPHNAARYTHTVHTQTKAVQISQATLTLSNRPVTFSSEVLNLLVTTAIVFCNKWLVDAVNGTSDIEGSTKVRKIYCMEKLWRQMSRHSSFRLQSLTWFCVACLFLALESFALKTLSLLKLISLLQCHNITVTVQKRHRLRE